MDREISRLSDHHILCGASPVGRRMACGVARNALPFLIIDRDANKLARYSDEGCFPVVKNATQAPMLRRSHSVRAHGLAVSTTAAAANIYIILSTRSLNPKLDIIARASEDGAEQHLIAPRTNHVGSVYNLVLYPIAQTFTRSHVAGVFDRAMNRHLPLRLRQRERLALERA